MSSRFWTMYQFTAPFRGRRVRHSGISVPGPGRLATGKIIKRRPSEVLRDEEVAGSNPVTPTTVSLIYKDFY